MHPLEMNEWIWWGFIMIWSAMSFFFSLLSANS